MFHDGAAARGARLVRRAAAPSPAVLEHGNSHLHRRTNMAHNNLVATFMAVAYCRAKRVAANEACEDAGVLMRFPEKLAGAKLAASGGDAVRATTRQQRRRQLTGDMARTLLLALEKERRAVAAPPLQPPPPTTMTT